MKVAHFVPAYRQSVHVEVAMTFVREAQWCAAHHWRYVPFWSDGVGIARQRNVAIATAFRAGVDLLLMQDSDVFPVPAPGVKAISAIGSLWETMKGTEAAVVGAVAVVRNGHGVNCEPAEPGAIYPGEVGTGLMLIDLRKLRELPRPWFVHRDRDDGEAVECSEDIYFCRHVQAAGHRVIVDYTITTGHAFSSATLTRTDA